MIIYFTYLFIGSTIQDTNNPIPLTMFLTTLLVSLSAFNAHGFAVRPAFGVTLTGRGNTALAESAGERYFQLEVSPFSYLCCMSSESYYR
jgi:hypothetical protein